MLFRSDTGECHEHDGVHRRSGRIFRLSHGEPRLPPSIPATPAGRGFDLRRMSDDELAGCMRHAEGWWVAQAGLVLAERAQAGPLADSAVGLLREQFATAAADPRVSPSAQRVRSLLTLHRAGAVGSDALVSHLDDADEHVRTWAIRLLTEKIGRAHV